MSFSPRRKKLENFSGPFCQFDETLVAHGAQRKVYQTTFPSSLLLKLPAEGERFRRHRPLKTLLRQVLPISRYRYLLCEIDHDIKVQIRSQISGIMSPIAPTRGTVQTRDGLGLLVQRIGPRDGGIGPSLDEFVKSNLLDDDALEKLNEFADSFFSLKIVAADINPRNIVWGEADGDLRPFIIDGFGDRNVIKLRTWVRWLRHRSIHLGMEKTARAVGLQWSRSQRRFFRSPQVVIQSADSAIPSVVAKPLCGFSPRANHADPSRAP